MNQLDLTDISRTLHPKTVYACSQVHTEINETKSCFFEKINKYDKLLPKLIKKKKSTQIARIRNETGNIANNLTETKGL